MAELGPIFEDYVDGLGLSQRLRFAARSFFNGPLPQPTFVIMGHILHDWDLETKRMLPAQAFAAVRSSRALVIHEAIIDDGRSANAIGLMMSLNMLIETPGGFDFTGAGCQSWMRDDGFRQTRVEHLFGPDSMVIGIK